MLFSACGFGANSNASSDVSSTGGTGGISLPSDCPGGGGVGGAGGTAGVGDGPLTGVISWPEPEWATNASIDDTGVFRLSMCQCELCLENTAQWQAVGDTVIVRPAAGESQVKWINDVALIPGVTEVHLNRGQDDSVIADVMTISGSFQQIWQVGRRCSYCCGDAGPFGHHPCPGPLPSMH